MFRLSRLVRLVARDSTGQCGVDVIPNARQVLISLYERTMELTQNNPENRMYDKQVYQHSRHKLKLLLENEDDAVAARKMNLEHLEEGVQLAEDELLLFDFMHKPQEVLNDSDAELPDAFGEGEHFGPIQIYPLPAEVEEEMHTGKVSLTPFEEDRPISVPWLKHLGLEPTEEQIAAYNEAKKLTPEEQAAFEESKASGNNVIDTLLTRMMKPIPIDEAKLAAQRDHGDADAFYGAQQLALDMEEGSESEEETIDPRLNPHAFRGRSGNM